MKSLRTYCLLLGFFALILSMPLSAQQRWEPANNGLDAGSVGPFAFSNRGDVFTSGYDGTYHLVDGNRWKRVFTPPQREAVGISGASIVTTSDGTMLMMTREALYKSTDNGENWSVAVDSTYVVVVSAPDGSLYVERQYGILISTDNGNTWLYREGVATLSGQGILHVRDDGALLLLDEEGGIHTSSDRGESWSRIGAFDTRKWIGSIFNLPDGTLLGSANTGLQVSSDGGRTWQHRDSLHFQKLWYDLNGDLYAMNVIPFLTGPYGIYRSVDSGRTWQITDSSGGWTMGISPDGTFWKSKGSQAYRYVTYRSSDKGRNWEEVTKGLEHIEIHSPIATDGDELFIARCEGRFGHTALDRFYGLYHSTDRGSSWQKLADSVSEYFSIDNRGWIFAEHVDPDPRKFTRIARRIESRDRGKSWQPAVPDSVYRQPGSRNGLVIAVTGGGDSSQIRVSSDGGITWRSHWFPLKLRRLHLTDRGIVVADLYNRSGIDQRDGLYHSTDSGTTWKQVFPSVESRAIASDDEGTIHLLGIDRNIGTWLAPYRSSDNGTTWEKTYDSVRYWASGFLMTSRGVVMPYGSSAWAGIISRDRGRTWSRITAPFIRDYMFDAFCAGSDGSIYISNFSGTMYRSTDDGENWEAFDAGIPTGTWIGSIVETPNGGLYFGSRFNGVYRIAQPSSVRREPVQPAVDLLSFTVTPQPLIDHGDLTINLPSSQHLRVTLHDMLGRTIGVLADKEQGAGRSMIAVDTGELAAGSYIVRVSAGGMMMSRVVVVR